MQAEGFRTTFTVPDLNIIENLWVDLKRVVHARQPNNISDLQRRVEENTRIERHLASYKKRLQAVISARRGVSKY